MHIWHAIEDSSAESECLKNKIKLQGKHYDMCFMPNPKFGLNTLGKW